MSGNTDFFPLERNRYFYGKLLTVRDFELEQKYTRSAAQLMHRLVFGAGVVCGLSVNDRRRSGRIPWTSAQDKEPGRSG